ncbi:heme ABC transporter permease [Kangiella japonica]|uniref:Heme exporter protein C n=1 Tax=Kangiella japonica TaxID=647384 RepID=A0ABP3CTP6_9GAMM
MAKAWRWFHQLGSPKYLFQKTGQWLPWIWGVTLILLAVGLYYSLWASPLEARQGQGHTVRIMYVHVPAAALSMVGYIAMAIAAIVGLVWKMKMAFAVVRSIAPAGAAMTFLALFTGSVWGKPTWGTWWEWDARMTSELLLLFLYLGYIALHSSFSERSKADKASAILAIVGVINIPIIYFSVKWWNTLHQGYSVTQKGALAPEFQVPLFTMLAGMYLLFAALVIMRLRAEIILRNQKSRWVMEWATADTKKVTHD